MIEIPPSLIALAFNSGGTDSPLDLERTSELAESFFAAGQWTEAESLYREIARHGGPPISYFRLGQLFYRQKKFAAASEWLREYLRLKPDSAEGHFELSKVCASAGRFDQAAECLEKALALDSRHLNARRSLAHIYKLSGKWHAAAAQFAELFGQNPHDADLFQEFGYCCQEIDEWDLARKAYLRAVHLGGNSPELHFNLGAVCLELNQARDAISCFQKALEQQSDLSCAHLALASAYKKNGDLPSAEHCLRQELQLEPNSAEAAVNLGYILQEQQRISEALQCYQNALKLNPRNGHLHWNFAVASLLAGDFKTGWAEYEWRWKLGRAKKPRFAQPEWDGGDLTGRTILLYAEQGFGDSIMFVRFACQAASPHAQVVLRCQPALKRLFRTLPELAQVVHPEDPLPDFHVHAPLMSLPRILQIDSEAAIPHKPYLKVPEGILVKLPESKPSVFKVGLAWASNPLNPNFAEKKLVSLSHWAPVLQVRDCEFYSLQVDPDETALHVMQSHPYFHDLSRRLQDFADTAAVIQQLDLVICVDTAVAHLTGGLGKPVWVLLGYSPDWRWMLHRTDSPWYPTMRLFRQARPGDWGGVIQTVASDLSQVVEREVKNQRKFTP